MALLEEKASKELVQYNSDLKSLTRVLEHDRKLKSFMGVKAAPRVHDDLSLTQRQQLGKGESSDVRVQTYDEAFTKIKEATGIEVGVAMQIVLRTAVPRPCGLKRRNSV